MRHTLMDSLPFPLRKRPRPQSSPDESHFNSPPPSKLGHVLDANATQESIIASVCVDPTQASEIESFEQGTDAWLESRRGSQAKLTSGTLLSDRFIQEGTTFSFKAARLSASVFGAAVGHSEYASPQDLIRDMLWGTVEQNDAMRYGSVTEDVACEIFERAWFLLSGGSVGVEHRGLMLSVPQLWDSKSQMYGGWCGVSPDGLVRLGNISPRMTQLLEIKCPYYNQRNFYSDRPKHAEFGIPQYYYDQIQGIMGLLNLSRSYFVVHLPTRTQVLTYDADPSYFTALFEKMKYFWFNQYVPAALACAHGKLPRGEITPPEPVRESFHKDLEASLQSVHDDWDETLASMGLEEP